MEKDTLYKVMPTEKCIIYIENAGLTINDEDTNLSIKSQSGLLYSLPNGEVVLVPTNFDLNYPGIIFKDKAVFQYYSSQNFFPIKKENMTWLERNNNEVERFSDNHEFYSKILTESLQVKLPFTNINDIKDAFQNIRSMIDNSKNISNSINIEDIVYSFGLALICYLKDYQNFQLIMLKQYENYNPYTYPMLSKDGKRIDVLSKVFRYIESSNVRSFENLAISIGFN